MSDLCYKCEHSMDLHTDTVVQKEPNIGEEIINTTVGLCSAEEGEIDGHKIICNCDQSHQKNDEQKKKIKDRDTKPKSKPSLVVKPDKEVKDKKEPTIIPPEPVEVVTVEPRSGEKSESIKDKKGI